MSQVKQELGGSCRMSSVVLAARAGEQSVVVEVCLLLASIVLGMILCIQSSGVCFIGSAFRVSGVKYGDNVHDLTGI